MIRHEKQDRKKRRFGSSGLGPRWLILIGRPCPISVAGCGSGDFDFYFCGCRTLLQKKGESLWVFLLIGAASIPINLFILGKYDLWIYLTASGEERGIVYYMSLLQYTLLLSSIEEIIGGLIARLIWKRQYKLVIPVEDDI